MTVVNQCNVQDVMWLDDVAIEVRESQSLLFDLSLTNIKQQIAANKFPAYFVSPEDGAPTTDTSRFFVVVALRDGFRQTHENAWRRLIKSEVFLLHLYDNLNNTEPDAKWYVFFYISLHNLLDSNNDGPRPCKIVDHPELNPALQAHKPAEHEMVLEVCRPKKADMSPDYIVRDFASRTEADSARKKDSEQWHHASLFFDAGLLDCQRRVEAVALFHPLAEPSNPVRWGLPSPDARANKRTPLTEEQRAILAKVKDNMELHRALVRGNGFYDWMVKKPLESIVDTMSSLSVADTASTCRPLPCVNFLDFRDKARAQAIVNEALPDDRNRFRAYLSKRPLGLGIITGVCPSI